MFYFLMLCNTRSDKATVAGDVKLQPDAQHLLLHDGCDVLVLVSTFISAPMMQ